MPATRLAITCIEHYMCPTRESAAPGVDPRTSPAARVVRTAFALRYAVQEAFRTAGLEATTAEWGLLNLLAHAEDPRVGDIAEMSRHDRTTITRVVDGLARRNLVERERDPKDRRAVRVRLSTNGKQLHGELVPVVRGVLKRAFAGISASERKALFSTLSRIHDNLLALDD